MSELPYTPEELESLRQSFHGAVMASSGKLALMAQEDAFTMAYAVPRLLATIDKQVSKPVRVAAAVVEEDGKVWLFQRGGNDSYTGKWEFPGGKQEVGEELTDTLRRELKEELDVEVEIGDVLDHYFYTYPNRRPMSLTFFAVKFLGTPKLLEHTQSMLVDTENLRLYDMMNGDITFVITRYILRRRLEEQQRTITRLKQRITEAKDWLFGTGDLTQRVTHARKMLCDALENKIHELPKS